MLTKTKLLFQRSSAVQADWVKLYEESFPAAERASIEQISIDLKSGKQQLHLTLDEEEQLVCFSLIHTDFDNFVWLSYIATVPNRRSQGVGAKHLSELIADIRRQFPERNALLLEIESTKESAIKPQKAILRKRRLNFYLRLGAKQMPEKMRYLTPTLIAGELELEADLLWFELSGAKVDLATILPQTYTTIYGLNVDDPLIAEVIGQFTQ